MIRILLVDDQPSNLFALQQTLAAPGYELVLADSGEKALAYLLRSECAVILLDVRLPDLSGIEVLDQLKKSPDTAPAVIMITADPRVREVYLGKGHRAQAPAQAPAGVPHG